MWKITTKPRGGRSFPKILPRKISKRHSQREKVSTATPVTISNSREFIENHMCVSATEKDNSRYTMHVHGIKLIPCSFIQAEHHFFRSTTPRHCFTIYIFLLPVSLLLVPFSFPPSGVNAKYAEPRTGPALSQSFMTTVWSRAASLTG